MRSTLTMQIEYKTCIPIERDDRKTFVHIKWSRNATAVHNQLILAADWTKNMKTHCKQDT